MRSLVHRTIVGVALVVLLPPAAEAGPSGKRSLIAGVITFGVGYGPHTGIVAAGNTPSWGFIPLVGPIATITHYAQVDCSADGDPLCSSGPGALIAVGAISFAAQALSVFLIGWGTHKLVTTDDEPTTAPASQRSVSSSIIAPVVDAAPGRLVIGTALAW